MAQRHELNFLEFLQSFRRGELLHYADQRLTELLEAMRDTGGDGSLTLKIALKRNKAGQVEATPEVRINRPTRALGKGIYFATEDGQLSRRDPNQLDIEDEIERRRTIGD